MSDKEDVEFSETSDKFSNTLTQEPTIDYADEEEEDDKLNDNIEIDDEDEEMNTEDDYNTDVYQDQDSCVHNHARYLQEDPSDEDVDDDIFDDDALQREGFVAKKDRITKPFITKYEANRIIGVRTKQLAMGAKPKIKGVEHLPPKSVAELELKNKILPIIIERPLPDGSKEEWHIDEFLNLNDFV